jgi:hypothetical protein
LNRAIFQELIALATLEKPVGGGFLIELDGVGVDEAQLHGEVTRLEENCAGMSGAIVDVFEIQAGVGGDEEVGGVLSVSEGGDAAVAGAMAFEDGIVDWAVVGDDGLDVSPLENGIMLVGNFEGDGRIRKGCVGGQWTQNGKRDEQAWQITKHGESLAESGGLVGRCWPSSQ